MACHRSIAEAVDTVYIEVDRDVAISDACFYVSTYGVGTIILATAACLIVFSVFIHKISLNAYQVVDNLNPTFKFPALKPSEAKSYDDTPAYGLLSLALI